MEWRVQRRLSVLSSHLRSVTDSSEEFKVLLGVSASNCDSDIGVNRENECVFCKIVRGQSPALKMLSSDIANANDGDKIALPVESSELGSIILRCFSLAGLRPGRGHKELMDWHSLIIPKCHFSTLEATPPAVVAAMCSKVPLISKAVMEATGCDSFNLLVNNGAAAGQVIFHTHIHIIPRKASDCLWTSESLQRRSLKLDQEGVQLAKSIRDRLQFEENFEDSKGQGSSLSGT